jgi:protein-S-isoprenylcysteine O-methyltransferase Ste14
MGRNIFKVIAATALFAGVHSLLATRRAKRTLTSLVGERRRNALHRPLYNAVAVLTTAALVLYLVRLPNHELYRVRKPWSRLMLMMQLASAFCLLSSVRQVGFLDFAGLTNLFKLLSHEAEIKAEPEGQGPALGKDGRIKATGPFRFCRHPLNFWAMPLLWLMPRMTVNLAVFNTAATIYLLAGSYHEEVRLRESYGEAYVEYERSGVSFLVPGTNLLAAPEFSSRVRPTS